MKPLRRLYAVIPQQQVGQRAWNVHYWNLDVYKRKFLSFTFLLLLVLFSCLSRAQEQPYDKLKMETLDKRAAFKKEYDRNRSMQDSIITEAQEYILTVSDAFFKAWYNTPWTFNGHSQTPKEGSIACGYFVTTTLRDMGFDIPRVKWAQQPSEYFINKVSTDIKRFRQRPIGEVTDYIKNKGEGLYIVGLDNHVGYIYYLNNKMSFIHANYYRPEIGVMSEPLIGRNPLNDSEYKVIGKIFDKEMVRNWILNTQYKK